MQVLIFSQFKIMMDVLEDSLRLCKYPVERIDGSVSSRDRQAAIDRYSKGELIIPSSISDQLADKAVQVFGGAH